MKTAIVYYSKHHENTKKLVEAMAQIDGAALVNVSDGATVDLSDFDCIGFASGIYYSKFHKSVIKYAKEHMPNGKKTFFVYTCGVEKAGYTGAISAAVAEHGAEILGEYGCLGYNTFGPFKLIGGIAKNHPDNTDIENAITFYKGLK